MSVNRDFFAERDFNRDFQESGAPEGGWAQAARLPGAMVPTHCCFCGVQCGMFLRVRGGKVVGVEPRDFPHNRGSLCPKGVVAYQQVGHPQRLLHPMVRRGGKGGQLQRASWDEALGYVVDRWKGIQAEHGRDAVAVYGGSSMTNEKCYLVGKFARVGLRTRHVDYNGRLCMSSSASAYARAFGIDRSPLPMTDIPLARCILVVGSNIAECFPILTRWLWAARDRGARLIVVDPRETPTARTADLWLAPRPGTDVALLSAILRQVVHDGRVDEGYVRERTVGWEEARAAAEPFTPEEAERISGVPAARVVAAARLYGGADPSLILHARGIEHSTHGVDACLACINLALARGQVGKPGGGTTMLTGQGNGQGGREHGQKANQLPGYRHIDAPEDRRVVAEAWGIPEEELPGEGAAATEMVGLMEAGRIRSCLFMCSNPLVSLPDLAQVERALARLDPLVVVDFFLSETAERADVVLPGTVWCEDEGTTTNMEGRVLRVRSAAEPPGEARRDWEILCDLAARLGRGAWFPHRTARQIWDELRRVSRGGVADYSGITWERIDAEGGVFWPCPGEDHPGTPRLFTERFGHPDGRARFTPLTYLPPAEEPDGDFPFRLATGRTVYHYLSGTQTRRLEFLNSQAPEPWVEVHPRAAEGLGIRGGDRVRLTTRRGSMELEALVAPTVRPDTLFVPYHYGGAASVNRLTLPAVEPKVKIPEYKVCAARLDPLGASPRTDRGPRRNFTADTRPDMFPYASGEGRSAEEEEGKAY
ncbi:molybdopterin oxidoreductase family protein [Myxococcota bacterium]|nr:molybdopterin oxidoreductase family protein [Myxococcota bacterium]